jgi:ubiquinone biosynthesis protein
MMFSSHNRPHRYRLQGIRHFGTISRILLKHGLGEISERLWGKHKAKTRIGLPAPDRIRRVMEDLGPSFIKLGQLLSTRGDVLPPEYTEELSKLQDQVPPVPFSDIQPLIEAELRQNLDTIFESIEENALAAASVAQVHTARLKSGEKVAVKVVRPGIEKRIKKDLLLMHYFAAGIEKKMELGRIMGAVNLVKEFEHTIFRELNMLVEGGHIERFAENFNNSDEIHIPRVHWQHTSKSVLVMEYIEGIKMDNVAEIKRLGIDPQEVAMIGLRSFSRQLMEVGLFHADPHPGNTLVMPDGRVGLVDFGIVGYLDEETMRQVAFVFLGFAEHDYDMVMEAFESAGLIDPGTMDLRRFRTDLKEMAEPFYGRSLKTISVKDVYDQTMRLVFRYQIRMPRDLLLLFKTFIQTEALGKILDSEASLLEVTRPYAKKLLERGYEAQKVLKNLGREFRSAGGYMRWIPKLTHDILKRLAGGDHRLQLDHSSLNQSFKRFEAGLNRLTIGLVISASLIAASLILNTSQKVMVFRIRFFGLETISITQLLGLTGYIIATLLGLWLIFSIFRSGKL